MRLIKQSRHKLFSTAAFVFALAFACNASAGTETLCVAFTNDNDMTKSPLSPDNQSLLLALSGQPAETHERMAIIKKALSSAPSGQHDPLVERARLVYAAWQLQQGNYSNGRDTLMAMPQESDLAAKAALLLAESWRLQGDNKKSLQWFLRIGQHYAGNVDALSGLLSAAQDLESAHRYDDAYTLYEQVIAAARAAEQLVSEYATHEESDGLRILQKRTQGPQQQVQQQLTRRMLLANTLPISIARTDRAAQQARQQLQCLLSSTRNYQVQRDALMAALAQSEQNSAAIKNMLATQQSNIESLTGKLIPGDLSEQQVSWRRQLSRLRNQHAIDTANLKALEANRDTLPSVIDKMDQQLAALNQYYRRAADNADAQLEALLKQACASLQGDFLDLAGEAALRSAELKRQHAHPAIPR